MADQALIASIAGSVATATMAVGGTIALVRRWLHENNALTRDAGSHAQFASAQIGAVMAKLAEIELRLVSVQLRADKVEALREDFDRFRKDFNGLGTKMDAKFAEMDRRITAIAARCSDCPVVAEAVRE